MKTASLKQPRGIRNTYFALPPSPHIPLGLFVLLSPSGYSHITGSHPKLVHCDPEDKTIWFLPTQLQVYTFQLHNYL
jgi:hypothetical protein